MGSKNFHDREEKENTFSGVGISLWRFSESEIICGVKTELAREVTTIRAEIAAAELNEQTEDASSSVAFETIKANLDHLIEIVRVSKT